MEAVRGGGYKPCAFEAAGQEKNIFSEKKIDLLIERRQSGRWRDAKTGESMRLLWLFLFILLAGAGQCQGGGRGASVRNLGDYNPPDCSAGPSSQDLERKKQALFRDIEDSRRYSSSKARAAAIRSYKNLIRTKEQTGCPEDVERMIEKIQELHRR